MAIFGNDYDIVNKRAELTRNAIIDGRPEPVFPEWVTGSRAIVYVNQKKVAACLDVSYKISIQSEPVRTIDSFMPWEIVPGQISVEATLRRFMHPEQTAASDHLFTIIQAALHTPYATLEIRDRLGNPLFVATGSFTDMEGQISVGAVGIESVRFQGYYWRQNDIQAFDPEIASKSFADKLKEAGTSKLGAINGVLSQVGF